MREVGAGAVAHHADASRVDPEVASLLDEPVQRRHAVDEGGREGVLRRAPVVHGQHGAAGAVGQATALGVVGLEVAEDEPAAVQVDQRRQRLVRVGPDRAQQPARHPTGVDVGDRGDVLLRLGQPVLTGGRAPRADAGHVEGVDRRPLRPLRERGGGLGVEAHEPDPALASRRASSSSTTEGSSLVKTGVGLPTGVPGDHRATLPGRSRGVVAGDDRVAGAAVEVVDLLDDRHRLEVAGAAHHRVDRVRGVRQERRQQRVAVADRLGDDVQHGAQPLALVLALELPGLGVGDVLVDLGDHAHRLADRLLLPVPADQRRRRRRRPRRPGRAGPGRRR